MGHAIRTAVHRRSFQGTVTSISGTKTVRVVVAFKKMHPKYQKQYSTSHSFLVHDEHGTAAVGDVVSFVECRPLSRTKRWRITGIKKQGAHSK